MARDDDSAPSPREAEAAEEPDIRRETVAGAGWSVGFSVVARAVTLAGSLAITYYLEPGIVGQVTDAAIAVQSAHELALSTTPLFLVASPDRDRADGFHVTVLHLATGLVPIALMIPLAPIFAEWMKAELLPALVPYFAFIVLMDRLRMIPERILYRDLRFRTVALAKAAADLAYAGVSLASAARGLGAMSMVWGNIARSSLWLVAVTLAAGRRDWLSPVRLELARVRKILRFSWPLAVASACNFASRAWDQAIVSSCQGDVIAGLYQRAHSLAEVPSVHVGEQIGDVLFPAFARMRPADRPAALVRSLAMLSLVVFPLAVGLGLTATTLIATALPPSWAGVGPPLAVMSILTLGRPLGSALTSYLQAQERSRAVMGLGVLKVLVLLVAAFALARISASFAAVAVGLEFGVHALASMVVVARRDGISLRRMLGTCAPALLASAAMAPAIFAARAAFAHLDVHTRGAAFGVELAVGAVAYVAAAFVVARPDATAFLALARDAIARRRARRA